MGIGGYPKWNSGAEGDIASEAGGGAESSSGAVDRSKHDREERGAENYQQELQLSAKEYFQDKKTIRVDPGGARDEQIRFLVAYRKHGTKIKSACDECGVSYYRVKSWRGDEWFERRFLEVQEEMRLEIEGNVISSAVENTQPFYTLDVLERLDVRYDKQLRRAQLLQSKAAENFLEAITVGDRAEAVDPLALPDKPKDGV